MEFYDSHTHLNHEDLFSDWKILLQSFIEKWGKGLVNAWANQHYNERGLLIAQEAKKLFPDRRVKCCLGFHPCDVVPLTGILDEKIKELKNQIIDHHEEVVAIGECGIDLHYDTEGRTLSLQQKVFEAQCKLARELALPIVIHSRDAFEVTLKILKNYQNLTIYFHCRGYGPAELKELLELFPNLYIGICGNVSYSRAEVLRESIFCIPKDRLLIETDAPYLAPKEFRGKLNMPERVIQIWSFVAWLVGEKEDLFRQQIKQNFFNVYKK